MPVTDNARELARRLTARLDFSRAEVLEIGCGDGRITSFLAPCCGRLVGLEYDVEVLPLAASCGAAADFLAGSGQCVPFSDESFDYVLFTLSLHHQDPGPALAEARRVVRPEGRVLVVDPTVDGELERMCYHFHYEAPELQAARRAIESSPLVVEWEELWRTNWRFDDFGQAMGWLYELYDTPPSAETEAAVLDFLQGRAADRPLIIEEDLVLTVLKKG